MRKLMMLIQGILLCALMIFAGWYYDMDGAEKLNVSLKDIPESSDGKILNAAFVCLDGVYNSELMAPYDILQHTIYRDKNNYINCFIVTPDCKPFVTSEGITITPHYSFDNVPATDILLIPSTETSMSSDLENQAYMDWIRKTIDEARYIVTLCDGAFPLAATGALNGLSATTFPGDRDSLQARYAGIDVRYDVNFVVDGKFITSVGGALSYEPALYLVEKIYSRKNAVRTAQGLVIDWQLDQIPHLVVGRME